MNAGAETLTATSYASHAGAMDDTDPQTEVVAFRVGSQEYCVDIMTVREIRGWTQTTSLPHVPPYVRGVINLRGTVLPVIDLAVRLGGKAGEPTDRHVVIVAQVGRQTVGLLVDAVSDIMSIAKSSVQTTPDVASEIARTFIKGLIASESRMICLVELHDLLPKTLRDVSASVREGQC